MKIRIFVFGSNDSDEKKLFDEMLTETFAEQLGKDGSVGYYASVKDAASSISSAFADSRAVLFFAEESSYCALKKILSKAFGFKLVTNAEALERAARYAPEKISKDPLFEDTHALVPEKAKIFIPSDGLFSGFAYTRGGQSVIFLPYSPERASTLLAQRVIPFINSVFGLGIPTYHADHFYARQLLKALRNSGTGIALAQTKTAELFYDYVSDSELIRSCIERPPKSEERGNMRPAEYVVNLSVSAAELMGVPYGIVLSNAFYMDEATKDRLTVFMAVTNDKRTTVREIRSFPWENSTEFMHRGCAELCRLLSEKIENDRNGGVRLSPTEARKIQWYKNIIAIITSAIILLCVIGGYIFTSHSYTLQDWVLNHFPSLFSQQVMTDDEMELPSASEETKEPSSDTEKTEPVSEKVQESGETLPDDDLSPVG